MTRNEATAVLFVFAFGLLIAGAGEAGAFVGAGGILLALMGPDEAHEDARRRNPNQARRIGR